MNLSGDVEIILTRSQARLLKRFAQAAASPTPGFRSHVNYLLLHFKVLVTHPRLFWLGEYYDPDELDLTDFADIDEERVRLTFHIPD